MLFSDLQLVRRLRANDRLAFEEVIERYYQAVFRQQLHLCGQTEIAADLTQETFVEAWTSLNSFAYKSTFKTWLYKIAVRVWYRWQSRSEGKQAAISLGEMADTLPDLTSNPAELVQRHFLRQQVQDELYRLPSPYREALVLFYVQDLKYREIAVVLDIPLGTVKSRLHEGLHRLRVRLEDVVENGVVK